MSMSKSYLLTPIALALLQQGAMAIEGSAAKPPKRGKATAVVAAATVALPSSEATATLDKDTDKGLQLAEFDRNFLIGAASKSVDLTHFSVPLATAAGSYRVDISVNERFIGSYDVQVKVSSATLKSLVCLPPEVLKRMNVLPQHWSTLARSLLGLDPKDGKAPANESAAPGDCHVIADLLPGATLQFDPSNLRVDISVPQAYIARTPRGYAPPDTWDEGITAGRLRYFYNYYQTQTNGASAYKAHSMMLDGGLNVDGWQFRTNTSLSMAEGQRLQRSPLSTYVRRNVPEAKAYVTMGQVYSSGTLFPSYSMRGMQFTSDARMRPDSQNGFAPVLRGQAMTNARVEVKLNGQLIHAINVTPGPFVIDDLYATGYGGDLVMTIIEADGSRRDTLIPFAGSPQLMREGIVDYSIAIGETYTPYKTSADQQVLQTDVSYGLNNILTLRAGAQVAESYRASAIGGAVGTSWGAFGLTHTRALAEFSGQPSQSGTSSQLSWAKQVVSTGTNVSLASYRYSTQHFYSLSDAISASYKPVSSPDVAMPISTVLRERSRAVASVSQYMGAFGSVYLSGNAINYWNSEKINRNVQLGYSRNFGPVQMSLSVQRDMSVYDNAQKLTRYSLSLMLPLDSLGLRSGLISQQSTYNAAAGTTQATTFQTGIGENNNTSVSLTAQRDRSGSSTYGSGSTRTSVGSFGLTAGQSQNTSQLGLTAYGGMVMHSGGITLAPELGETVGIVRIEGSEDGVRLNRFLAAPPDSKGYSVTSYLSPFRINQYELDLSQAAHDVEMETTQQTSVPMAGAIVSTTFKKRPGNIFLLRVMQENGEPVPFGATVKDLREQTVGFVGQASKIEARLVNYNGELKVRWGTADDESCVISYNLPEGTRRADRKVIDMLCKPTPGSNRPIQQANQMGLLVPAKNETPSQQPVTR